MAQLTQETWEAMSQAQRDAVLGDLVKWPRLDKPFPIVFSSANDVGKVVDNGINSTQDN